MESPVTGGFTIEVHKRMADGRARGQPEERAAQCALWNGAYAGGSAIGPLVSTMLYVRQGWSAIIVAQVVVSLGASAMLLGVACLPGAD